jgi:hypothetical protein
MPFILAIEPDPRQAACVRALAAGSAIAGELLLVESIDAALDALEHRVPDLLLTSLLLSPKDDAALTMCLRTLDAGPDDVQTLVIPVLASAGTRSAGTTRSGGLLSRLLKGQPEAPPVDGCDPQVFAAQVNEYLARAESDRRERALTHDRWQELRPPRASAPMLQDLMPVAAEPSPVHEGLAWDAALPAPEVVAVPTAPEPPMLSSPAAAAGPREDALTARGPSIDDALDEAVEEVVAALAGQPAAPAPSEADTTGGSSLGWNDIEPFVQDLGLAERLAAVPDLPHSEEDEPELFETPPTDELWMALGTSDQHAMAPIEGPAMRPAPMPADVTVAVPAPASDAPRPARVKARKPARTVPTGERPAARRRPARPRRSQVPAPKPMQDEWGLYDPAQCGFAALLDRLEAITQAEADERKGRDRSAIMRR